MSRAILVVDVRRRSHALKNRLQEIREIAHPVKVHYFEEQVDLEAEVAEAEIIACLHISPSAFLRANNVKWIHDWSAGVDRVLFPEIEDSSVTMTCSKGNGAVSLSEHAMMLMLMLDRDAPHYIRAQDRRRREPKRHGELNGTTVGLIGIGNTGADLARKCKAFNMRVIGINRSGIPCRYVDELFTRSNLHNMLNQSDFVVVTAPLTRETKHMLGEAEFKEMKPSSYLIIVSRGDIAVEDALIAALRNRWIAGAGLDAAPSEPLENDHPFWTLPNTIITPHIGANSQMLERRSVDIFIDNLKRYVQGIPLNNIVNKSVGY